MWPYYICSFNEGKASFTFQLDVVGRSASLSQITRGYVLGSIEQLSGFTSMLTLTLNFFLLMLLFKIERLFERRETNTLSKNACEYDIN
jgi:hypothetical protein